MPSAPEGSSTALVVELDRRFGAAEAERTRDIVHRYGGVDVDTLPAQAGHVIKAVYHSVCDATSAVVEIVDVIGESRSGVRMAVCEDIGVNPMQLLAETGPGQILATAPTAVVAGPLLPPGIDLLDRGVRILEPGKPPERIYEMVVSTTPLGDSTSNVEWARRAVDDGPPTLDKHLSMLAKSWREASQGRRRMLLISGESRATRTVLTAELALRLHAEGALVLYGRWDEAVSAPYQAFREALGVYAAGCSTELLRSDLEGWADEIAQLLPEVGARVGGSHLPRNHSYVDSARMFEAIERWVLSILNRSPVLLVLDDLQWAEPASLLLLAQLWHACRRRPMMILVTGSEEASQSGDVLGRLTDVAEHTEAGAFEQINTLA